MKMNRKGLSRATSTRVPKSTAVIAAGLGALLAVATPLASPKLVLGQNSVGSPNARPEFSATPVAYEGEQRGFVNPFSKLFGKKETTASLNDHDDGAAELEQRRFGDAGTAAEEPRASGGLLVPLKSFTDKVFQLGRSEDDRSTVQQSLPQHAGRRHASASQAGPRGAASRATNRNGTPETQAPADADYGDEYQAANTTFEGYDYVEDGASPTYIAAPTNARSFSEPFQSKSASPIVTKPSTSTQTRSPADNSAFFESKAPVANEKSLSNRSQPQARVSSNASAPLETLSRDGSTASRTPAPIITPRLDDQVTTRKLSDGGDDEASSGQSPMSQGIVRPLTQNPILFEEAKADKKPSLLDLSDDSDAPAPATHSKNGGKSTPTTAVSTEASTSTAIPTQSTNSSINLAPPVPTQTTGTGANNDKSSSAQLKVQETNASKASNTQDSIPLPMLPSAPANAPQTAVSAPALPAGDNLAPSLPAVGLPVPGLSAAAQPAAPSTSSLELPAPSLPSPALPSPALPSATSLPTASESKAASPIATPQGQLVTVNSKQANAPIDLRKASSSGARSENLGSMHIPGVEVTVHGPSTLLVGQETMFEVVAKNQGNTDLNGLLLRLTVPASVTLGSTHTTDGMAESEIDGGEKAIVWELPKLATNTHKSLRITLTTEQPEHFALAVEWTAIPQSQEYAIQVQQPRLEIAIEGASEAVYGSPVNYRIRVKNPGNAVAKNVDLTLEASTYGSNASNIGDIPPGGEEVIEVELLFEKAGEIPIIASVVSETSNAQAQASIGVEVLQSELVASIGGPSTYYQGSIALFELSLTNQGKATALDTTCTITLPPGAVPSNLSPEVRHEGSQLIWTPGSIAAGETVKTNASLNFEETGSNTVSLVASTSSGAQSSTQHVTTVDAIVDLQLTVNDPLAPAPVAQDVYYDLELFNRGRKTATSVNVLVQFSEGIEPIRNEGHDARIVPGQVIFNAIPSIAPGERVKLRVVAEASKPGVHRFRVEAKSDDGETALLQEASTRYLDSTIRR